MAENKDVNGALALINLSILETVRLAEEKIGLGIINTVDAISEAIADGKEHMNGKRSILLSKEGFAQSVAKHGIDVPEDAEQLFTILSDSLFTAQVSFNKNYAHMGDKGFVLTNSRILDSNFDRDTPDVEVTAMLIDGHAQLVMKQIQDGFVNAAEIDKRIEGTKALATNIFEKFQAENLAAAKESVASLEAQRFDMYDANKEHTEQRDQQLTQLRANAQEEMDAIGKEYFAQLDVATAEYRTHLEARMAIESELETLMAHKTELVSAREEKTSLREEEARPKSIRERLSALGTELKNPKQALSKIIEAGKNWVDEALRAKEAIVAKGGAVSLLTIHQQVKENRAVEAEIEQRAELEKDLEAHTDELQVDKDIFEANAVWKEVKANELITKAKINDLNTEMNAKAAEVQTAYESDHKEIVDACEEKLVDPDTEIGKVYVEMREKNFDMYDKVQADKGKIVDRLKEDKAEAVKTDFAELYAKSKTSVKDIIKERLEAHERRPLRTAVELAMDATKDDEVHLVRGKNIGPNNSAQQEAAAEEAQRNDANANQRKNAVSGLLGDSQSGRFDPSDLANSRRDNAAAGATDREQSRRDAPETSEIALNS